MSTPQTAVHPSTAPSPTVPKHDPKQAQRIRKAIAKKSFAVLASTSEAGRSHSAGVMYAEARGELWVHTMVASRKARNVASNPHVGLCVVYRRLPVGPPYTIHFQALAETVALDAPEVRSLVDAGHLKQITSHGELEIDGACFLRIRPAPTIHSFGTGVRTIDLIRDPINKGGRTVQLGSAAHHS